ncbi:unnamed protein product [Dicrocoelium dendriticum]|nr:unnamed protein product [Dicrocoelium dendriticum]
MNVAVDLAYTLIRAVDPLLKNSVLLCHGLFGSKQNWKSMSRALHKDRCGSICAVDLRNHGLSPRSTDMSLLSMAYDIIKVVNDLKLQDVCLVGHSLGGKAAMCAALLESAKFSRMIVLDSSPVPASQHSIMRYLKLMLNTDLYRAERESDGSLGGVRQWLSDHWKDHILDDRIRSFLLTNLDQSGKDFVWRVNLPVLESCWHAIMKFPTTELQGRVFENPALFVAGGRSDHLKNACKGIVGKSLEITKNAPLIGNLDSDAALPTMHKFRFSCPSILSIHREN